jgi:ribosomal protein RSM22 (predicted rRNA methylase)
MTTPSALAHALATLDPPRGLAEAVERLTNRYHGNGDFAEAWRDPLAIPAYLHARMPATAAAVAAVLARLPPLGPTSLLDLGSGCGAALWAARERWPDLTTWTAVERETAFAAAGMALWDGPPVRQIAADLRRLPDDLGHHDVVLASYALNELPPEDLDAVLRAAWERTGKALILIEPGMPRGFGVIAAARRLLVGLGGAIAGPCPGAGPCPLETAGDFCRFAVRLARSRTHRLAKGTRGFEDEPYSWLAVVRGQAHPQPRVVRPPHEAGDGIHLSVCTTAGLTDQVIRRRDPGWKAARRVGWGDLAP